MLEALLDNPLLIFILIGIISSLFGKSKSAGEGEQHMRQQPQQQQRMERQTPNRSNRETMRPQPSPFEEMRRQMENRPVHQPTFQEVTVELENEFEKRRNEQAAKLKELQERQRSIEKAADDLHTGMKRKPHLHETKQKGATDDPLPTYGSRLIESD